MKKTGEQSLCEFCKRLDVRLLLLKAKSQGPPLSGSPEQIDSYESIHAGVPRFLEHRPNLISLRNGAEICSLCSAIWNQFSRNAQPYELTDAALSEGFNTATIHIGTEQWVEELNGLPTIAVFQYGQGRIARRLAWFEAFADRDNVPVDNSDLLGRSVELSAASDACLAIASHWLSDCMENHQQCKQYTISMPPLPRRVVEISSQNGELLMARVIDTNGKRDRFVALSYCWGGPGVVMFTTDTEEQLRAGLPVTAYPPTLRDTMLVTHKLGIKYVWIDCLCIKQDDKLDWGRQAVQMQGVYRYATVTLRAACANKVIETLFPDRANASEYCALPWHGPAMDKAVKVYLRAGSDLARMNTSKASLSRRGWTLEEDLLAPRTLTFDEHQICFDCANGRQDEAGRHTRATEGYNDKANLQAVYNEPAFFRRAASFSRKLGIPSVVRIHYPNWEWIHNGKNPSMNDLSFITHTSFFFQGQLTTPGGVVLTYFDLWRSILNQYARRTLTQSKDVLTALAGLAEVFHQTHGDTYYAGMWRSDFVRSMNWQRLAAHRRAKDGVFIDLPAASQIYLAPSWSWASISGKSLSFIGSAPCTDRTRFTALAKVIDVHVDYTKSGVFGPLSGGYVILRVPFIEIPDPREEVTDGPIPKVRKGLSSLFKNTPETVHEFNQQHRAHADQRFAIIRICNYRDEEKLIDGIGNLLIESCDDGSWRRIGCFQLRRIGRNFKKLGQPPGGEDPQYEEMKAARLLRRTIKIV